MYYVHVLMAPGLWKLQSAHQKIQGLLLHKQASAAGIKLTQLLKMTIIVYVSLAKVPHVSPTKIQLTVNRNTCLSKCCEVCSGTGGTGIEAVILSWLVLSQSLKYLLVPAPLALHITALQTNHRWAVGSASRVRQPCQTCCRGNLQRIDTMLM